MVPEDDRREFQRLKLPRPILATMDGESALVLDVGMAGAYIEHHGKIEPGANFTLSFRWQGEELDFVCEVARTRVIRPSADSAAVVSHSGVRFVDASAESRQRLEQMMVTFIARLLDAQRANASGDDTGDALLGTIGEARRGRSRGCVRYHFRNGEWMHEATTSPRQPSDGFTVAAFEDDEEVAKLCEAYERADEEGRNLIRLVAELSAAGVNK